jgi:hypothetical protein
MFMSLSKQQLQNGGSGRGYQSGPNFLPTSLIVDRENHIKFSHVMVFSFPSISQWSYTFTGGSKDAVMW